MDQRFHYYVWHDGCAVFDRETGNTHILDPFSGLQFLYGVSAPERICERIQIPKLSNVQLSSTMEEAKQRLLRLNLPYSLSS